MFDDMFEEEFDGDDDFAPPNAAEALRVPRETTNMFGNETTENTLLDLYNKGKFPHAIIFSGPQGVGKATMAFRLARFLLKHGAGADDDIMGLFGVSPPKPETFFVDENDPVFKKISSGGHPDLRYYDIPVDAKTGKKKTGVDVETVREISPFLRKTTSEGGWRVVIVDDADTMNRNAQNAILKILEEPPQKSIIILICNRLGSMLPTIRSRCRVFHFAPLSNDNLMGLLKRIAPSTPESEVKLLAAISDGSMGRAQMLLEEGGVNMLRTLIDFIEEWPNWDWSKIHPMADNLSKSDSEKNYLGFTTIFEWTCQSLLRAKAVNGHNLPEILKSDGLLRLLNHYSLEQWIEICEKLNAHFIAIDHSNLDKRQGVIGAFALLGA